MLLWYLLEFEFPLFPENDYLTLVPTQKVNCFEGGSDPP